MKIKVIFLALGLLSGNAWCGPLTFQFINPNFGGNPSNGSFLLSEAAAQNSYQAPGSSNGYTPPSAVDTINSEIQSQLLSSLMSNISAGKSGSLTTSAYIVNLKNIDGQLNLSILDRSTGQTSLIQVDGLKIN